MNTLSTWALVFAQAIVLAYAATAGAQAPAGYYSSATGTGATLESQLATIMSTGHIQRTYGNFRDSAAITDRDPNNPNNILLVYNRASVPAVWDQGSTWNREHTWPQSRQPGSASNSTRGNLGDPHALRPANPSINSSRGNKPFGNAATTGGFGSLGTYYFPGDADKGDTARQLFYSAVRYGSQGLSLVDGFPGTNQMGDLDALIAWHYSDAPDVFERNRNNAIYSQALNPSYYTNNRNAFIDHPEFVWSVFVDQQNDTQLSIAGESVDSDGGSQRVIDFGSVYVGGGLPSPQTVNVSKQGDDGTYYRAEVSASAAGVFTNFGETARPFELGDPGSDSFLVGIDASTAVSGEFGGTVRIDNLDVTTGGGVGVGANDADDAVIASFRVFDHPIASFADTAIADGVMVNFGSVPIGANLADEILQIFNYDGPGAPILTSDLDIDSIMSTGDEAILAIDLMPTSMGIDQGEMRGFSASFDTSVAGVFSADYTITLSGEDLPGELTQTLSLTLLGEVAVPEPASLLLAMVAYGYLSTVARRR